MKVQYGFVHSWKKWTTILSINEQVNESSVQIYPFMTKLMKVQYSFVHREKVEGKYDLSMNKAVNESSVLFYSFVKAKQFREHSSTDYHFFNDFSITFGSFFH